MAFFERLMEDLLRLTQEIAQHSILLVVAPSPRPLLRISPDSPTGGIVGPFPLLWSDGAHGECKPERANGRKPEYG